MTTPRAALFVPADRPDRYARAFAAGADAVILDLEDAVAPSAKETARSELSKSLPAHRGGSIASLVRINSPLLPEGRADLAAVAEIGADGLVVPKADPESVELAAEAGLPLVALVETATGVLAAERTAAHPAVAVLMFGPVDLAAELGLAEAPDGDGLNAARSHLVLAAAAAGLPAPLDGPCLAVNDDCALDLELARAKRLGFAGKACIHPAQVGRTRRAFSPSEQELRWAHRVLEMSEGSDGRVLLIDGQMVDRPVIARARRLLGRGPS